VVIETLKASGLERIGYIDIDAHHGDGVFYAYESDPAVIIADLHEDGRHLYPGTGTREETGRGEAVGTKLNVPLPPGADDALFAQAWESAQAHIERYEPEFILLQCGADSIGGDPITHLALTPASHARVARDLRNLAESLGHGKVLAMGGGGYDRRNLATAWTAVVEALL
jgi:acetoin utilization protein AcuC